MVKVNYNKISFFHYSKWITIFFIYVSPFFIRFSYRLPLFSTNTYCMNVRIQSHNKRSKQYLNHGTVFFWHFYFGQWRLRVNQCDKTKVVDVASKMQILIINHFEWYKNLYVLSFSLNVREGKILDLFIQSSFLKFSSLIAIQIKILILNIFLEQNEN